MDTASQQSRLFAAAANGHTFSVPILLQATCTTCGATVSEDMALAKTIPPCGGRIAGKPTRGHWFDGFDCKLCGQTFENFFLTPGDHSPRYVEDLQPPRQFHFRELPQCPRCDHAGALVQLKDGDPRMVGAVRDAVERGHTAHLCLACGTQRITQKAADGS